jgi:nucleoside-triphosphatase THEP1
MRAIAIAAQLRRGRSYVQREQGRSMFDAQCDLAALVYDDHDDPDAVLRNFATELNAQGFRAIGMVQAGQCADSSLSAVLVHSGETLLLAQDPAPGTTGCKLDLARLQDAGARVAGALENGADILIVNRFGKRERDGKGLSYLIERALDADIPVVIAVSRKSFADWIKFAGGMSVKLACDRHALEAWWRSVSLRNATQIASDHVTVCEVFK